MATCAECVHYEVCQMHYKQKCELTYETEREVEIAMRKAQKAVDIECDYYKDRSRFVELPDVGNYDTVTTIDEAIDHCYQIATSTDETVCAECKAEHMRLCGWLGDLKRRITAEQAEKEREA